MTTNFYKRADGIIIVYDITNIKSFQRIDDWMNVIDENTDE